MAVVTVPKVLREKLSEEGADALVELINKADEKQKEDILKFLEEKFEAKLSIVGEKFERRLAEEIGKVEVKIEASKAELIRWMFIFIMGQFWAIVGVLFAFFRK